MKILSWVLLTMLLGITTGLCYDFMGPDSGTLIALGLSTTLSGFITILKTLFS